MIAGVGIDIVDVRRVRRIVEGETGVAFVRRTFTDRETRYCRKFKDPYPHFAGRFAVKEAFIKAAGFTGRSFALKGIETVPSRSGAPVLRLGDALDAARYAVHVSISHTDELACAFVVIEEVFGSK